MSNVKYIAEYNGSVTGKSGRRYAFNKGLEIYAPEDEFDGINGIMKGETPEESIEDLTKTAEAQSESEVPEEDSEEGAETPEKPKRTRRKRN